MANSYNAVIGLDTGGVERRLAELGRELRAIDRGLETNRDNAELTSQRYTVLGESIAALREKLERLRNAEQAAQTALQSGQITDAQYRSYRREIEQTEAELRRYTNELNGTQETQEQLNSTVEQSGQSMNVFMDILKADAVKTFARGVVDGLKSAFGAATQLVQQATAAYGQYEQLVGGVETLFAGAEDKVIANAQQAFSTAGISANKYMEQVTSFAASLTNSLAGDTEKAVELADQAIIDMSDNANKLGGTSMQSIQWAYQGFAKQNYTMLDNLKLGYGGTKKEMQRLIDDVNSWRKANGEAADLSISKFSDVVTAIHEVQEHIGITGTTADEAARTIQGSAGAVKAAWENLLVGLADPTSDLDRLINDLIDTGMTAAQNMLPTMMNAVGGLAVAISEAAPHLGELLENFDEIAEGFLAAIEALVDEISDNLDVVFDVAAELAEKIADYAGERAPDIITKLAEGLTKALPVIFDIGVELALTLINTLAETIPDLLPAVVECIIKIGHTIAENVDEIVAAGVKLAGAILEGLWKGLPDLLKELPDILQEIQDGLYKAIQDLLTAGKDIVEKIGDDMKEADWEEVGRETVKNAANALVKAGQSPVVRDILAGVTNGWSEMIFGSMDASMTAVRAAAKAAGLDPDIHGSGGKREPKEQEDTLKRTAAQQVRLDRAQRSVEKHNEYINSQIEKWKNSTPETLPEEPGKSFAELLEEKESEWDRLYNYEKESYDEYWVQRMAFLRENEEDTEEWYKEYNKTRDKIQQAQEKKEKERQKKEKEAQAAAEKAEKERQAAEKEAQAAIENALKSFKNDLNLAVASGKKSESQANEELINYIETQLVPDSELYKTELASALNKRRQIQEEIDKEAAKQQEAAEKEAQKKREAAEKERQDAVKKQWRQIEKDDLEAQKTFLENMSFADRELFSEYLEEYNDNIDTYLKKRREETDKLAEQGKENAEKVADIYRSQAESIREAVNSGDTVKDEKSGKDRYIFTDYRERLKELREYQKNLSRLQQLNIPPEMIQDIFSLDYKTRALYIKELLGLSAEGRQKYINDYTAWTRQTSAVGEQEAKYARKEELTQLHDDVVADLNKDMYGVGADGANAYINGFVAEMRKRGLDITPGTLQNINDWAAANPTQTAQTEVMNKQTEMIQGAVSAMNGLFESFSKGGVSIVVDGKKLFAGYLKDAWNKTINISDKSGGVLA